MAVSSSLEDYMDVLIILWTMNPPRCEGPFDLPNR